MTMPKPCTWPVDRSGFPALPASGAEREAALANQLAMEDLAVDVLWALSGQQFGVCPVIHRPLPIEHQPGEGPGTRTFPFRPNYSRTIIQDWNQFWRGTTGSRLNGPGMVTLPGPVAPSSVDTPIVVTIGSCEDDGPTVLDPSEYSVEGNVLYRRGNKVWPFQDLGRPMGECCTWSVRYYRGLLPPRGAAAMVGALALEFIRANQGDAKCRLPKSVTRMSRNGVNYELDPLSLYQAGKTGIPEIDSWLAAVNPNHIMQAPSVL